MDDDFLYRIRPPVRKEFAKDLKRQLSSQYPDGRSAARTTFPVNLRWAWKAAFISILVFGLLLFTFSGEVRAGVMGWIQQIAGFQVEERLTPPVVDSGEPDSPSEQIQPTEPFAENAPRVTLEPSEAVAEVTPTIYAVPTC